MNDKDKANQFSSPDSQLDAAVWSVLAQPLDDDAIERVIARAKSLNTKPYGPDTSDVVEAKVVKVTRAATNRKRFGRSFWVSIAACLFIVIGMDYLLFSGNKTAFASAIEKLRTAGNLTFVMKMQTKVDMPEIEMPELPDGFEMPEGFEIEESIPEATSTKCYVSEGRAQYQFGHETMIFDGANGLMLDRESKEAEFFEVEDELEGFEFLEWLGELKSKSVEPVKSLGKKTLSGVEVEGFIVEDLELDQEMTIWIDTQSDQIVVIEFETTQSQEDISVTVTTTLSDFQYDQPLDESIFELAVPEGYKVIESALDE